MTIPASPSKVILAGDGITTTFGFLFELFTTNGSDLQLTVFDNLGNPTILTGNYTVNVAAGKFSYPTVGGVLPLLPAVNALPVGWQIVAARVEPLAQSTVILSDQGSISLPAIALALDYLTAICQQLQEQINRAPLVPINTPGPATPVVPPAIAAVGLVQINGTFAQLSAYAALNPTVQFLGLVSSGDAAGSYFFYSGNVALGNNGFIAIGGG